MFTWTAGTTSSSRASVQTLLITGFWCLSMKTTCHLSLLISLLILGSGCTQGRMTDPFTLLINFGPRNPAYDSDYTKYPTYFALHVDKGKTWFSFKVDSKVGLLLLTAPLYT